MTEQELMSLKAPWPKSIEELNEFITSMVEFKHSYNSCPQAMSLAAEATFNFVSGQLGVTGFQASYAAMQLVGSLQRIKGPYMLIRAEKLLYPQYDVEMEVARFLDESREGWCKEEAVKLLEEKGQGPINVAPRVYQHWIMLADR